MSEEKKKRDFSNFKLKVQRTPTNERSYQRYAGRMRNSVQQYTDEELIKKLLMKETQQLCAKFLAIMHALAVFTKIRCFFFPIYFSMILLFLQVFEPKLRRLNKEKTVSYF